MMPIRDLLNRIRWDPAFGRGRFELAYHDHASRDLVRVPLEHVRFPSDGHYFIEVTAPDGVAHDVPLHRIRVVWRDGTEIWQRADPDRR
jgi:uncharacterized protein (UPF0248 family)